MTREEIEKAANKFHGSVDYWTTNIVINFAVEQVNAALEEAAHWARYSSFVDCASGTVEAQISRAIRALKVKP